MVNRIDWRAARDPRDLIHQAMERLNAGKLVVFPTETHYVAAASAGHADAASKLEGAWAKNAQASYFLAIQRVADLPKYVQAPTVVGRRLVERCWPGPVTLIFPTSSAGRGLLDLPETTQRLITGRNGFAMRIPQHAAFQEALRMSKGPLLLGGICADGRAPTGSGGPALDAVEMLFDDGPPRFSQPATTVVINSDGFEVVETGVVAAGRLQRLANEMIVFVCTGNTCRSPMAEALLKRMLADQIGCDPEELPDKGYTIVSAGLAAGAGAPAAENSRRAIKRFGASLDDHAAQSLTPQLAMAADRLLVMTREHQEIVSRLWPAVAARTSRVGGDHDIADPFGGPLHEYEAAAEQIAFSVRSLVGELRPARS